jgi:hypothetical protein
MSKKLTSYITEKERKLGDEIRVGEIARNSHQNENENVAKHFGPAIISF